MLVRSVAALTRGVRSISASSCVRAAAAAPTPAAKADTPAAAAAAAAAAGPVIDKVNPLHAPDNYEPWRNEGVRNLAPGPWKEWADLPAPYKYYSVKARAPRARAGAGRGVVCAPSG
jgi:hypothetical protein